MNLNHHRSKFPERRKGKPKLAQKKQNLLMNKKRVIVSSGPQVKLDYTNDPSNKSSNAFAYEHVWMVMKDCPKHYISSKVHGYQASKRQKSNSNREYTSSTNAPEFGISLDDDDGDIQVEQEPPSRRQGQINGEGQGQIKG
ncbi:hypothetical protein L1987_80527 [Smallanthus sonchifolius]|uniref:Uncharacterized protein n=1 Tax=Smallanthus sonchifolius TaxID=185202 RepID=A0ACB8YNZ1_9ASTR|nr:hypothetical protein L1987_80527 [Smallanthus sonchifolius]